MKLNDMREREREKVYSQETKRTRLRRAILLWAIEKRKKMKNEGDDVFVVAEREREGGYGHGRGVCFACGLASMIMAAYGIYV